MPRTPKPSPEKSCMRCGSPLQRKRYNKTLEDMGRFQRRKFCSLRCANSRGIRSQSFAQQHVISAKFVKPQCESCGKTTRLHVHHVNGNWKDHRAENLKTLCCGCHLSLHNKKEPKPCKHCSQNSRKHGMCQKHFQRWKKYGDPFLTKVKINGKYTLTRTGS